VARGGAPGIFAVRRATLIYRGDSGPEELSLELASGGARLRRGESEERVETARLCDGRFSLLFGDGRQVCGRVLPAVRPGEVELVTGRGHFRISIADPLQDRLAHSVTEGAGEEEDEEVRALMPGRIVEVAVVEGERVPAGGLLLVLEAMKMQNEIRSARGGTVARVAVEPGKAVEGGALMAVLKSVAG
jgi:biotin carboxyl carrier protein